MDCIRFGNWCVFESRLLTAASVVQVTAIGTPKSHIYPAGCNPDCTIFAPETGAVIDTEAASEKLLTATELEELFASLSERLNRNPKYRLPGDDEPFQTTIVVHGGAIFVMLIKSRNTTPDIDYLAGYTDALLESNGLTDPIVLISREIEKVGIEAKLGKGWMNFNADTVIRLIEIADENENEDDSVIDVFGLIGAQSVAQNVILYEDPGLKVYAMEWCWVVCCKLDHFGEQDQKDIVALLAYIDHPAITSARNGNVRGAAGELWAWIENSCPAQVANWQADNVENDIRDRVSKIADALNL